MAMGMGTVNPETVMEMVSPEMEMANPGGAFVALLRQWRGGARR